MACNSQSGISSFRLGSPADSHRSINAFSDSPASMTKLALRVPSSHLSTDRQEKGRHRSRPKGAARVISGYSDSALGKVERSGIEPQGAWIEGPTGAKTGISQAAREALKSMAG